MITALETITGLAAFLAIYDFGIYKPLKRYQPIYELSHQAELAARDERSHA
ncbi:Uncharacterised protein [Mycobacteroides abscessus subsp. abscessus]|uniref:hypothetical protein n=1 Tax=Mycobacteroides abscessus TaxID=36809 RepID=UPI00092CC074|nr:hypothetical protein [Mycobacteroides abscessus]SIC20534.1 Uncharacterised protein [Mycobacteroides abscessus subsp. abscessus]